MDKRSIEKVLAAAGSSLGGSRERVDIDEREKKDGREGVGGRLQGKLRKGLSLVEESGRD